MHGISRGDEPMSDEVQKPQESSQLLEMPWVLISNQIQQLNTSLNERFNDVNARLGDVTVRMDDMNASLLRRIEDVNINLSKRIEDVNINLSKRMEDVNTNLSKRIEDVNASLNRRIDGLDKRMDGLAGRLTNRVSIWVAVIAAIASAFLGHAFNRVHF